MPILEGVRQTCQLTQHGSNFSVLLPKATLKEFQPHFDQLPEMTCTPL